MKTQPQTTQKNSKTIEWRQAYETGVPDIDIQHRKLITILNKILEIDLSNPSSAQDVKAHIFELAEYIEYHFGHEEELMADLGCADLVEHKKEHKRLLAEMKNYHKQVKSGKIKIDESFVEGVRKWLMDHLTEEVGEICECAECSGAIQTNSAV